MPFTLIKPNLLSMKNRLKSELSHRILGREILVVIISAIMIAAIYGGTFSFMRQLRLHPAYSPVLPARMAGISLFAFFALLLFSNSIAALGYLYSAKDIPLLLTSPVSSFRLYTARLISIVSTSSWMFAMFSLPATFGFAAALDLPPEFLAVCLLAFFPFVIIPAALGVIIITIFVNIVPPYRIRDLLVIAAFLLVCSILFFNNSSSPAVSAEPKKLNELVTYLWAMRDFQPYWLPSAWVSEIFSCYLTADTTNLWLYTSLLAATALGCFALGFIVFDYLFFRGLGISLHERRTLTVKSSSLLDALGHILIPFDPQLRAICYKEIKMFIRDTTQSLQLLLLLMLTFVYLYNFRSLQGSPEDVSEIYKWWHAVLALANVAFGACVVAAIATRFIFPSISLEGRAYALVRAAPLSIEKLLEHKFRIWFFPTAALSLLLLVSGTWAIYSAPETIAATAILAIALSIGIVGLGVGIGAVYAKFDWDSPAQVTASFGSLVYMLLALALIMLTLVLASMMFVLTTVPSFAVSMSDDEYLLALACSFFLVFFVNYQAAHHAMNAGAERLKDLER